MFTIDIKKANTTLLEEFLDRNGNATAKTLFKFNEYFAVSALETGKVTAEQALEFDLVPQIEALKTGKLTAEQALKFHRNSQVEAFLTGKLTVEQALKIDDKYEDSGIRKTLKSILDFLKDYLFGSSDTQVESEGNNNHNSETEETQEMSDHGLVGENIHHGDW